MSVLTLMIRIFNQTLFVGLKDYMNEKTLKLWGFILLKCFECEYNFNHLKKA